MAYLRISSVLPAAKVITVVAGILFTSVSALASCKTDTINAGARESLFPQKSRSLAFSHFTWGAEAGASIDMTGHDMSSFDVDVLFGYKNSFFRLIGLGAGIHRAVQSGNNFIPIYATIQSSFRSRPSLFFFSARFGYSFNTIDDSPTFGDFVSAIGCGINLSQSRHARSYFLFSVGYRYFNHRHIDYVEKLNTNYVYMTHLTFGVSF